LKKILPLILLVLTSCSHLFQQQEITNEMREQETARLNEFFERVFEENLARSPESQTYMGRKTNYDQLNDISDENAYLEIGFTKKQLRDLKKFNPDKLTHDGQMSYFLFKDNLERGLERVKFRYHWFPVNQMFGQHAGLPSFMINMHRIESVEDAHAYISRIKLFDRQLTELVKLLETRRKKGIIAPKFVFPKAISDSQNIISGMPFDKSNNRNALVEDFEKKISTLKIDNNSKQDLMNQLNEALIASVLPGYQKLIVKLEELEKVAPELATAWTLPNGDAFYRGRLKHITTTDLTPEEIHQFGLDDTKRIHEEMLKIVQQVKFKGDLQAFFKHMKTAQQFRYPDTEAGKKQYITDTKKIIARMEKKLPEMFGILPKAELTIKPVEAFREKSAGLAFYQGPSEEGNRPGIYYINLSDMQAATKYEQEALAYHEAVPGHHMQISIATELKNLPKFRRFGGYTAYSEGWGLYAELLPLEFGFYKDPYSNFGRLTMELWRAARLVVDTGLHHKKWSMEQAVQWLDDNTPSTHEENIRAIQRYTIMPGQATAYKIGMKKILDLRAYAEAELGKAFDIRGFHDEILKDGSVPMDLLEEKIKRWVSSKKSL